MARPRMTHRPRDMFLSLAVILVPILVIMALFTRHADTPVRPVDVAPVLAQARAEASFPVLAPTGLPGTWVPTRATWVRAGQPDATGKTAPGSVWINGWLSPGQVYVALVQTDAGGDAQLAKASRDARRDGERAIAGTTWEQYRTDDDRTRALVRREATVTTIVTGDLSYDDLQAFVTTLA